LVEVTAPNIVTPSRVITVSVPHFTTVIATDKPAKPYPGSTPTEVKPVWSGSIDESVLTYSHRDFS
jgi:hypothetical protein